MDQPVFDDADIIKYAETRLFGKNISPDDVSKIELYNAFLPSGIEAVLKLTGSKYSLVEQANPREPIYFSNGTLLIPQYSGVGRQKRYESLIEKYIAASHRKIKFERIFYAHDEREARFHYENLAYDFIVGLFVPTQKHEDRRVFDGRDVRDISTVIFGPTAAVAKQAEVEAVGSSSYLDAQIVNIAGESVLNIGYVYSDQARFIIHKMLREYDDLAKKSHSERRITMLMFGRVGGLADGMKRHDLVFPNEIIKDTDLRRNRRIVHPLGNVLSFGDRMQGINLGISRSVLDETVDDLLKARDWGCACAEMETLKSSGAIQYTEDEWEPHGISGGLHVDYGFAGHVSDLPLQNDNLAKELDSDKGEQAAVSVILDYVQKNRLSGYGFPSCLDE